MKRPLLLPLLALPALAQDPATNMAARNPHGKESKLILVNGKYTAATPRDKNPSRPVIVDGKYADPERESLCLAMRDLFRQIRNDLPEGWWMEETENRSLGRFLLPEPSFFAALSPPGRTSRWMFSCLEAAEQIPGTNRFERIDLLDDETMFSRLDEVVECNEETLVVSNRTSGFTVAKRISSLNRGIVVMTNDYVAVHLMVFSPAREWADWDGFAQSVRDTLEKADWSAFRERRDNAGKPPPAPATPSPAEETHAESAENAEPEPHAESAESAELNSHAENAEPKPHAETVSVVSVDSVVMSTGRNSGRAFPSTSPSTETTDTTESTETANR